MGPPPAAPLSVAAAPRALPTREAKRREVSSPCDTRRRRTPPRGSRSRTRERPCGVAQHFTISPHKSRPHGPWQDAIRADTVIRLATVWTPSAERDRSYTVLPARRDEPHELDYCSCR